MQLWVLLILILAAIASAQQVRYVKPSDSTTPVTCPGQPCLTLDQYLERASAYFTSGTAFIFLTGNHTLELSVQLEGISNISFSGDWSGGGDVYIIFKKEGEALFENITHLNIERITFILNSTFSNVAVIFSNCIDVQITSSFFKGKGSITPVKGSIITPGTAAISLRNTSLVFRNCLFQDNRGFSGGALQVHQSNATLYQSSFVENEAEFGGGAIDVINSAVRIIENSFMKNKGKMDGGAINAANSTLQLTGNFFCNNTAEFRGGAIYVEKSILSLTGNFFDVNTAEFRGGAIYVEKSILNLTSDRFLLNSAKFRGGAVSANSSIIRFSNSSFTLNKANISGPAIFANNSRIYRNETYHSHFVANNILNGQGPQVLHLNSDYKVVGSIFDRPSRRFPFSSSPKVHLAGLTFPVLRGLATPSIIAYYSMSQGSGYVGIIASLNKTNVILTSSSSQKYMLYSVRNPQILSFFNRNRPVSILNSISGRNGFLAAVRAIRKAQKFFVSLGAAVNSQCSSCSLDLMGIGYFANSRFFQLV